MIAASCDHAAVLFWAVGLLQYPAPMRRYVDLPRLRDLRSIPAGDRLTRLTRDFKGDATLYIEVKGDATLLLNRLNTGAQVPFRINITVTDVAVIENGASNFTGRKKCLD